MKLPDRCLDCGSDCKRETLDNRLVDGKFITVNGYREYLCGSKLSASLVDGSEKRLFLHGCNNRASRIADWSHHETT